MNLHGDVTWRFKAFEDCPAIFTSKPPNWFHRWMFRLLLGAKWEKQ